MRSIAKKPSPAALFPLTYPHGTGIVNGNGIQNRERVGETMETVRIGVIGIGNMGSAHARNLYDGRVQGACLGAVCDIDPVKRAWAATAIPGVPVFPDHTALLDSGTVDALVIATPHYRHPPIAIDAFARGLHVLTEKPAGVYTAQVEEMNAAAAKAGTVFAIMFNQRTNPLFRKAHELVHGGRLGVPKRLTWIVTNWYRTQSYYDSGAWRATWAGEGGGVLLNQAPHNLDIWQWIFGVPQRVRAACPVAKYHHIEVEDEASIYADYASGATAVFLTTTGECPGTNRLEIAGDRGKLVIEEGRLRYWELGISEREFCFTCGESFGLPPMTCEEYAPPEVPDPHLHVLQNYIDAIREGTPLIARGEEGLGSLMISNAAYLSAWTGETVSLPVDAARFKSALDRRVAASAQKEGTRTQAPAGEYSERWNVRW